MSRIHSNRHAPRRVLAIFVTVILASSALPSVSCERSFPKASPPSLVLLIVVDTLRADTLLVENAMTSGGITPNQPIAPRLRSFAEGAQVFTNAWGTSSWTRPSMASLMTSRYPIELNLHEGEDRVPSTVPKLATLLREEGYQTIAISSNDNITRSFGFAEGFDRFVMAPKTGGYEDDVPIAIAETVTELGLRALAHAESGRPIFLYLHYMDPHQPYLPHPNDQESSSSKGRFDGSRRDLRKVEKMTSAELTDDDRQRLRDLYHGEVRYCDRWIGRLLDALDAGGLRDKALIVVTADHGEAFWEHGVLGHGYDLYQETLHVPLIIDSPGSDPRINESPVSLLDIAPTILDHCDIATPAGFRGRSLRDAESLARDEPSYAELRLRGKDFEAYARGPEKIIRDRARPPTEIEAWELYRLDRDPGETVNARDSEFPRFTALREELEALTRELEDQRVPVKESAELPEALRRTLEDMGYLEKEDEGG